MERFIHKRNLLFLKKQLAEVQYEAKRLQLLRLLTEEEAKETEEEAKDQILLAAINSSAAR